MEKPDTSTAGGGVRVSISTNVGEGENTGTTSQAKTTPPSVTIKPLHGLTNSSTTSALAAA